MVHILHDLHPHAGDDEEESGPNVSQMSGSEERVGHPHMSPIPAYYHKKRLNTACMDVCMSFLDIFCGAPECCICSLDARLEFKPHPDDRKFNLLPKHPIESFRDALWLGIQPFLCFTIESRKVVKLSLIHI